jgi:hypothetical protein
MERQLRRMRETPVNDNDDEGTMDIRGVTIMFP